MKSAWVIIAACLVSGCSLQQPQPQQTPAPEMFVSARPASSSALAFDPPITLYQAPLDLTRSGRGTAAFAGFENVTTSYFDIYTDDRQTNDQTERFQREAYIDRVGSITR